MTRAVFTVLISIAINGCSGPLCEPAVCEALSDVAADRADVLGCRGDWTPDAECRASWSGYDGCAASVEHATTCAEIGDALRECEVCR